MAKRYENAKGRRSTNEFLALPKPILQHDNFLMLSPHGNKLLLDLGQQYRGLNNGDLCATWAWMRARGWRSKDTLNDTLRELEHYGLIVCTQHGGLNRPNLYALSWRRIDKVEPNSKWSLGETPSGWKQRVGRFVRPSSLRKKASPSSGVMRYG